MEKNVIYVMTLIISMGGNIKWVMKINICLIPLKEILEINYSYGYLKQPKLQKYLVECERLFICQIMVERGGLLRSKGR